MLCLVATRWSIGFMLTVPVSLPATPYEVKIAPGLLANIGAESRVLFPAAKACALVTDTKVGLLYAADMADSLKAAGFEAVVITVPAGENAKCFAEVESINRQMIRAGLGRQSFVVALGGGVVGDLAGFAASVFYRGIPFIQIPTTVVSLVDSSVGGKTGINTPEGKNLVGTFHQPRLVLADPTVLETLPDREFNEGFAEIIKHAAIRDATMLPDIIAAATAPRRELSALIARNVAIKAAIVTEDRNQRPARPSELRPHHRSRDRVLRRLWRTLPRRSHQPRPARRAFPLRTPRGTSPCRVRTDPRSAQTLSTSPRPLPRSN